MKANEAFDMMEKILPYMSEFMNDEEGKKVVEMTKNKEAPAGVVMRTMLPFFITKHRQATFGMVSAITGRDIDSIREMEMKDVLAALKNGFDSDMLDFFGCCLRVVRVL